MVPNTIPHLSFALHSNSQLIRHSARRADSMKAQTSLHVKTKSVLPNTIPHWNCSPFKLATHLQLRSAPRLHERLRLHSLFKQNPWFQTLFLLQTLLVTQTRSSYATPLGTQASWKAQTSPPIRTKSMVPLTVPHSNFARCSNKIYGSRCVWTKIESAWSG